jgi:hypothetical protein
MLDGYADTDRVLFGSPVETSYLMSGLLALLMHVLPLRSVEVPESD